VTAVSCAVEGVLDEVIARALLAHTGHACGPIYGGEGKAHLRRSIGGYAQGARHGAWFVLVDLDHDHTCAAALVESWLRVPPPSMCLRVAVREVEAWLLADRVGIAEFLSVSRALVPRTVDELDDPKACVTAIATRSRRRAIREGIPPRAGSGRTIGPLYVSELSRFAADAWNIEAASSVSPSLRRCMDALWTLDRLD
jgi:hypothetical protein